METETINNALAKLENDLRKIDSARVQVEQVTNSSNGLTNATHKLVIEVKNLALSIKNETVVILSDFSDQLTNFDQKIDQLIGKSEKKISEHIRQFETSVKNLENNANDAISKTGTLAADSLKKHEEKTREDFDKIANNLVGKFSELENCLKDLSEKSRKNIGDELEKFTKATRQFEADATSTIKEVKKDATIAIKKQEESASKSIELLGEYTTEVQYLIDQINVIGLPIRLDNISSTLSSIQITFQNDINNLEQNLMHKVESTNEKTSLLISEHTKLTKKSQTLMIIIGVILFGLLSVVLINVKF